MSDFQDKLNSELDQVGEKPVKKVKISQTNSNMSRLTGLSIVMALLIVGFWLFNKNLERQLIEKRSQESFGQYNGPGEPIKSIPESKDELWAKVEENSRKITLLGYANNQNFSVYKQDHHRNDNSDIMIITKDWRASTMPSLLHLNEEDQDFISNNVR